jgi:hypothetical protein
LQSLIYEEEIPDVLKYCLPKGTKLHHGTAADFSPEDLNFPAWFAPQPEVAKYFETWRPGFGVPRTLVFETTEDLSLAKFYSRPELENAFDNFGLDIDRALGGEDEYSEIQTVLRHHHTEGWIIPGNYKAGDDIVLLSNEKLRYIGTLKT